MRLTMLFCTILAYFTFKLMMKFVELSLSLATLQSIFVGRIRGNRAFTEYTLAERHLADNLIEYTTCDLEQLQKISKQ